MFVFPSRQSELNPPQRLVEALEERRMLSASPLSFKGGTMHIRGNDEVNAVVVSLSEDGSTFTVTMTTGETVLTKSGGMDRLKRLRGNLRGGNDSFTFDASAAEMAKRVDMQGGAGDDELHGANARSGLKGGKGNDLLIGGAKNDKLVGSKGNDTLVGNDGKDKLIGNDGADDLDGGLDEDLLVGGGGIDTLDGGDGIDTLDSELDDIIENEDPNDVFNDDSDDDVPEEEDPE